MEKSETKETISELNNVYFSQIKPAIAGGNIKVAYEKFGEIKRYIDMFMGDIARNIHCGIAYIGAAKEMYESLGEGKRPDNIDEFEALAAQTKLPKT